MSDTPRTDAEQEHVTNLHNDQVCSTPPPDPYYVPAEFARGLERELANLRAASQAHLDRYLELVNSGDAGHWNPEQEEHVINLRRALNP